MNRDRPGQADPFKCDVGEPLGQFLRVPAGLAVQQAVREFFGVREADAVMAEEAFGQLEQRWRVGVVEVDAVILGKTSFTFPNGYLGRGACWIMPSTQRKVCRADNRLPP